jgi:hypothetical protein
LNKAILSRLNKLIMWKPILKRTLNSNLINKPLNMKSKWIIALNLKFHIVTSTVHKSQKRWNLVEKQKFENVKISVNASSLNKLFSSTNFDEIILLWISLEDATTLFAININFCERKKTTFCVIKIVRIFRQPWGISAVFFLQRVWPWQSMKKLHFNTKNWQMKR